MVANVLELSRRLLPQLVIDDGDLQAAHVGQEVAIVSGLGVRLQVVICGCPAGSSIGFCPSSKVSSSSLSILTLTCMDSLKVASSCAAMYLHSWWSTLELPSPSCDPGREISL